MKYNSPLELILAVKESFYHLRDKEKILDCVSEDISWMGTQANELAHGKEELDKLLEENIKLYPYPLSFIMEEPQIKIYKETATAYIKGKQELKDPHQVFYVQGIIHMIYCDDTWKVQVLTMSVVTDGISTDKHQPGRIYLDNNTVHAATYYLKESSIEFVKYSYGIGETLGYSEEEFDNIVRNNALNLLSEEDRIRFLLAAKAHIPSETRISSTFRVHKKDGSIVWVNVNQKVIVHNEQGYLIEAAFMRMSHEMVLYYDIANQATNGIYVVSKKDYCILYVNESLQKLLEKNNKKDIIGKPCHKVLFDNDSKCKNCVLDSKRQKEYYISRFKKSYLTDHHDIMWGGVKAEVIYISDISKEKQAMNEISQIYNNIPGAAFRCRFDDDWTVLSANDGLYTFLGYTREEFKALGNKMSAVIYPDDYKIMKDKILKQLVNGNKSIANENRLVCKDGTIKWISIKGDLLTNETGEQFFYCVFVDITKQIEEEKIVSETRKNLMIAVDHAKMLYWEYDFKESRAYVNEASKKYFGIQDVVDNYPESYLDMGFVSANDIETYRENVYAMKDGADYREFVAMIKTLKSDYVWMKCRFTGIKDENNKPVRAICTAELITEYKELEERFATTLLQNNVDSWIYDIPTQSVSIKTGSNPPKKYGQRLTINDIPEIHIKDHFCHKDDADRLRRLYLQVNKGIKQVSDIIRFYDEDRKEYRWRTCSYTTVFDRDNIPLYAVGSSKDVTDEVESRKRYEAEVEYRKHTQLDNQIFSAHCNLIKNVVLEISDDTGENLLDRFSNNRDKFFNGLSKLIDNKTKRKEFKDKFFTKNVINNYTNGIPTTTMECSICFDKKKKEYLWVQFQLTVIIDPSTNELDGFIVCIDKTNERKQNAILSAALQWDYDFISSWNTRTDTLDIYRNKEDFLHKENVKEKMTMSYLKRFKTVYDNLVIDDDKEMFVKCMSPEYVLNELKNKDIYEVLYHVKGDKGDIRVKRARFALYDEADGLVVFSKADITEMISEQEKQRERLAQSLEIANNAMKAKTDFMARMSHDMRTPMNAIIGLSSLTIDEANKPDVVVDNMSKMRSASDFLLGLVNDILDMAKLEDGSVVLNMEPYQYSDFLLNMKTMIKPQCDVKGITMSFVEPEHIDPIGMTDKLRINQIFFNIFSNAVKYTPSGGHIECSIKDIKRNNNIISGTYIVKDTGIGMSKEFQKHMFDPFAREDNQVVTGLQGSGLGLSITKQLIELMGGHIEISSKKNKGTTVAVTLSFELVSPNELKRRDTNQIEQDESILEGKNILLCEDHPLNAQIATRLLEKKGCIVTHAENGQEGVEKFKASDVNDYDLILMDIRMPVLDGIQAARAIRKLNRKDSQTVPIIALSANAYQEDIQKSLDAGMNNHLAKPVEPQLLYETMIKVLGH